MMNQKRKKKMDKERAMKTKKRIKRMINWKNNKKYNK